MKVYVKASINNDVFSTDTTGMSYYDTFLTGKGLQYMQDSKNETGSIEYMTPAQYYAECSELFGGIPVSRLRQERTDESLSNLIRLLKEGTILDMPVINWASEGQEGLHRMLAAETLYGEDIELPVLVVDVFDSDRAKEAEQYRNMVDFERYDLPKVCEAVVSKMTDWDKLCPPENEIISEFEKRVKETALDLYNADIEVESEITEAENGGHLLKCYLLTYNGMHNESAVNACDAWIENMYEMPKSMSDTDIDEFISNLDLSELDLEDF